MMTDDVRTTVEALQAENTRLRAENAALQDQQTALAEVLRVIASSPVDRTKVLDAIAEAATRFTDSDGAIVQQVVGDHLRAIGSAGKTREWLRGVEASGVFSTPVGASSART